MVPGPVVPGYRFLGWGPSATPGAGWGGAAAYRCPRCGEMFVLGGGPRDETGRPAPHSCACGCLREDPDAGRFGCCEGDDAVAVYAHEASRPGR